MDASVPSVMILDLETCRSAAECRNCGEEKPQHARTGRCPRRGFALEEHETVYVPIGWNDYPALGLALGCALPLSDLPVFFDGASLGLFMESLLTAQAHLVTFNGTRFDIPLLCAVAQQSGVPQACWKAFAALPHYDILHEIRKMDTPSVRGVNSLAALAQSNDLGSKTGEGAQAPRDWRAGRCADVINYCLHDCVLTRALYSKILLWEPIVRGNGAQSLVLPLPPWEEAYRLDTMTHVTEVEAL